MNSKHFDLHKISHDYYYALDTGLGAGSNCGVVDLGKSLLVIDTLLTTQAALDFRKSVEHLFSKPVQFVAITHWHGDHVRGSQVYHDTTILSTSSTKQLFQERMPARVSSLVEQQDSYITSLQKKLETDKNPELFAHYLQVKEVAASIQDYQITLPSITFDHPTVLHGNSKEVELIPMGNGHSECDSIVYIKEHQISFVGDLLFVGMHPVINGGNIVKWLDILKNLLDLDCTQFIPGHGEKGSKKEIELNINYLEFVMELAAKKPSEEEIKDITLPKEFKDWKSSDLFSRNVKTAMEQI